MIFGVTPLEHPTFPEKERSRRRRDPYTSEVAHARRASARPHLRPILRHSLALLGPAIIFAAPIPATAGLHSTLSRAVSINSFVECCSHLTLSSTTLQLHSKIGMDVEQFLDQFSALFGVKFSQNEITDAKNLSVQQFIVQ